MTIWVSPARRTAKVRSPSWVGSTVQKVGRVRLGFGIAPNWRAIVASVVAASNLPATSSTALSGWYQVR